MAKTLEDKEFVGNNIKAVLEGLFPMLRQNDVTSLEKIMKGEDKEMRRRSSIRSIEVHYTVTES